MPHRRELEEAHEGRLANGLRRDEWASPALHPDGWEQATARAGTWGYRRRSLLDASSGGAGGGVRRDHGRRPWAWFLGCTGERLWPGGAGGGPRRRHYRPRAKSPESPRQLNGYGNGDGLGQRR